MLSERIRKVTKSIGNRVSEPGDALDPIAPDLCRHLVSVPVDGYPPHASILPGLMIDETAPLDPCRVERPAAITHRCRDSARASVRKPRVVLSGRAAHVGPRLQ